MAFFTKPFFRVLSSKCKQIFLDSVIHIVSGGGGYLIFSKMTGKNWSKSHITSFCAWQKDSPKAVNFKILLYLKSIQHKWAAIHPIVLDFCRYRVNLSAWRNELAIFKWKLRAWKLSLEATFWYFFWKDPHVIFWSAPSITRNWKKWKRL